MIVAAKILASTLVAAFALVLIMSALFGFAEMSRLVLGDYAWVVTVLFCAPGAAIIVAIAYVAMWERAS